MNKKEISMTTKKRLTKLFTYVGEQEQHIEFARQNLCKANAFEPYASFQRIDRLSKGYLTPRDILNFMKDNGIDTADETDSKQLIKFFDSTNEDRLIYTDYLQILLPCDQPYLRAAATQRPTYPVSAQEYLPFEVERLLAKLIQKELKLARESERLKQELASRYDYSMDSLFKDVDDWNYKYIDAKNLKRYLIKTGVFPSDGLLIAILRRFDLDADAKLNIKEFSEGIAPQLDYSKRQVKEKQTLAADRVLSASKAGQKSYRSMSKSAKSPLRSNKSMSRAQKSSAKKQRSQSKTSKSGFLGASTAGVDQQFSTLQIREEDQKQERQQELNQSELKFHSTIQSPSRNDDFQGHPKEHSPLRMKSLASQNELLSSKYQSRLQKSIHSPPKANMTMQDFSKSYMSDLQQLRESRSPLREKQRNEDGEASLIFLNRQCFKEILAIESDLEQVKKEIAVRSDFTLAGAFNLFTGYSQARVTPNDLLYGLERLGVVCDISDAKLFVERYDSDKDGRLGFWEFSNALLPIDSILRDDLERRKAVWELSYETKELLRRVFRKLVDAEMMIEAIRQRISRESASVSLRKAFDTLDWLGRGYVTNNEFKRSFEQIGSKVSTASLHQSIVLRNDSVELEGMIRRFNKDKLNGRVSLPEFLDELSPKSTDKSY